MEYQTNTHKRRQSTVLASSIVAILLVTSLALSACSSSSPTAASGSGSAGTPGSSNGSLTMAVTADPRSLDPTSSTAEQEINISEQITQKLIEFNTDSNGFVPVLAVSWKQKDPTTLELKLRQGVKFTNGEDFDAESAANSIEVMRKAPAYTAFTDAISGTKVVDKYTLDVLSAHPSGLILNALALGSFQYPLAYWKKVGTDGFGAHPVGTGPYELKSWQRGSEVTLEANPNYWGSKPKVNTLIFKVIPDPSAEVAAIQSGQAQFMFSIPIGSMSSLKNDKSVKIVSRPSDRTYLLSFSELTDTPLKDAAVRRALQYAIDVPSLIKNQLDGLGTPLNGQILPPNYVGYDSSIKATPYDPSKAKQLLSAAGYANGFTITFKYSSGHYPQDKELGQAISQQLAAVGVTTKQQALEAGTFLSQLTSLKLNDMFMAGYLTSPDAHFMYDQFITGAPYVYYKNATVDELVEKEATTVDQKARVKILQQITKTFEQDPAFIPLFQGTDTYALAPQVSGFTPTASQYIDFTKMTIN